MHKTQENILEREFLQYTEDEIMHVMKSLERWGFEQDDLSWIFTDYNHDELLSECNIKSSILGRTLADEPQNERALRGLTEITHEWNELIHHHENDTQ